MQHIQSMSDFNALRFKAIWEALGDKLDEIRTREGLAGVIDALRAQQFDRGFIQDDLKEVIKYRIIHPNHESRYFIVQYNPRRAMRHAGAGRKVPPPGSRSINGGCFLCRDNIRWQQRGIETGYEIRIPDNDAERPYVIWMNPFPLMPNHVTVATLDHTPQSWLQTEPGMAEPRSSMGSIVHDLLHLVDLLPGYVGFYNGDGAGATIPGHFHFQFFKRPEGQGLFPLESAAKRAGVQNGGPLSQAPVLITDYPISAIAFHGNREEVMAQAVRVSTLWEAIYRDKLSLSANLIGTPDPRREGYFHLYFVPRTKTFSRGPGMVGIIAGLEVLGEIVFSTENEKGYLDQGLVDYAYVERILSSVEAPRARELWQKVMESLE
ncbi:MAG: DUF4922 domain-containing protein [Magnetococcales bacterium]|nr:DUF4922 domain-containing protein [Magnetococcales bacterium]